MKRGDRFYVPSAKVNCEVTRVARNGAWADVHYTLAYGDGGWRKRQPLVNGEFAFPVEPLK